MHLRVKSFFLAICLLGLLPSQVLGQDASSSKNIIAGAELTSLFHKPGTLDQYGKIDSGAYYRLITQVLKLTGLDQNYEVKVYPMARAKKGFVQRTFACYSPGDQTFSEQEQHQLQWEELLIGQVINSVIGRVISNDGDVLVSDFSDINKKDTISLVRGIPETESVIKLLNRAGSIIRINSEIENLKMLHSNRTTKAIILYPDVLFAYKKLNIQRHFPYDKSFSPLIINDNIICHHSHTEAFNKIEQEISRMKLSGELEAILGEAYIIGTQYMEMQ